MRAHRPTLPLSLGLLFLLLIASPAPAGASGAAAAPAAPGVGQDSAEKSRPAEIEALRAEAARGDGDARTHTRLGWRLLEAGDYDAAISSFDQALQLNPRSADAKAGKGAALGRQGELATAESLLKESLAHNPDPVRAHYELGLLYDRLGSPEKALAEFKAAAEKYRQGRR